MPVATEKANSVSSEVVVPSNIVTAEANSVKPAVKASSPGPKTSSLPTLSSLNNTESSRAKASFSHQQQKAVNSHNSNQYLESNKSNNNNNNNNGEDIGKINQTPEQRSRLQTPLSKLPLHQNVSSSSSSGDTTHSSMNSSNSSATRSHNFPPRQTTQHPNTPFKNNGSNNQTSFKPFQNTAFIQQQQQHSFNNSHDNSYLNMHNSSQLHSFDSAPQNNNNNNNNAGFQQQQQQSSQPPFQDEALLVTNVLATAHNELKLSSEREREIAQAVAFHVSDAYQTKVTQLNSQLAHLCQIQQQQVGAGPVPYPFQHGTNAYSNFAQAQNQQQQQQQQQQTQTQNQSQNFVNAGSFAKQTSLKSSKSSKALLAAAAANESKNNTKWTEEQDRALKSAVQAHEGRNWKLISQSVPGRDHVQCLQRWKKVLRPGLVKGHWSPEEDAQLLQLIQDEQMHSWAMVAERIPGRTAKQCRERWSLNLDPGINRSPWTNEEDALLLQLYHALGGKWSEIKLEFDGRTENAVKTRFKSLQRAKQREWTPDQDTRLMELRAKYGKNWAAIKKDMPGRSRNAIKVRCKALEYGTSGSENLGDDSFQLKNENSLSNQNSLNGTLSSNGEEENSEIKLENDSLSSLKLNKHAFNSLNMPINITSIQNM